MSEVLILEFAGVTPEQYRAVDQAVGIDVETGEGDWPAGLESHTAAFGETGLVIIEVWETREANGAFMARLGPALAQVGVPDPIRMEWLSLFGRYSS